MWTAKIVGKDVRNDKVVVSIEYTDKTHTMTKHYESKAPDAGWLERVVWQDLRRLAAVYAYDVTVGDAVIPPDSEPEPVDEDLQRYTEARGKLEEVRPLIEMGVIDGTDTRLQELKDTINELWATVIGVSTNIDPKLEG